MGLVGSLVRTDEQVQRVAGFNGSFDAKPISSPPRWQSKADRAGFIQPPSSVRPSSILERTTIMMTTTCSIFTLSYPGLQNDHLSALGGK